ncbi:hypothetical protein KW791_00480 [Candidatus Parcubacteria bacterium]|nr:hypothetical protein [Candidatus Parcubacteria bacterium]
MGQTITRLADRKLEGKAVFNNRFVVEICEKVHVHYRNLRIILSLKDWISVAQGMADALKRWEKLGSPDPGDRHIELCRKEVACDPIGSDDIAINLNRNLYLLNEGKIFAEGAELSDQTYIHLKVRDQRLELSLSEFNQLADAIIEAKDKLCVPQS